MSAHTVVAAYIPKKDPTNVIFLHGTDRAACTPARGMGVPAEHPESKFFKFNTESPSCRWASLNPQEADTWRLLDLVTDN